MRKNGKASPPLPPPSPPRREIEEAYGVAIYDTASGRETYTHKEREGEDHSLPNSTATRQQSTVLSVAVQREDLTFYCMSTARSATPGVLSG